MDKPLIYIDQNVLGLQIERRLDLTKVKDVELIYSKEHFAEIKRSPDPMIYLEALRSINANLLTLNLKDFKLTGGATLDRTGDPEQRFSEYLDSESENSINSNWIDAFQVWVNGGGDEELLKSIPEKFAAQIQEITERLPIDIQVDQSESIDPEFQKMIDEMASIGNDINQTRKHFGGGKGQFGNITGEKQLQQIWEVIKSDYPEITSDQFFGFDPPIEHGYETAPMYLGVVGCCAVLDILGFQAEKKIRKLDKIENVRSDAAHIGMAAYCQAILSADRKLVKRAKAIYEYKNIGTTALLIETKSKSMESE